MPPRKSPAPKSPSRGKSPSRRKSVGRSKSPAPSRRSPGPARKSPGKVPGRVGRPPKEPKSSPGPEEEEQEDLPEVVEAAAVPEPPVVKSETGGPTTAPSPAVEVNASGLASLSAAQQDFDAGSLTIPSFLLGWGEPLAVAGVLTAVGYAFSHWELPFDIKTRPSSLADSILALMPVLAIAYQLIEVKADKRGRL